MTAGEARRERSLPVSDLDKINHEIFCIIESLLREIAENTKPVAPPVEEWENVNEGCVCSKNRSTGERRYCDYHKALFAPPASEEDIGTGEFVEDGFGSAWEKCRRPDCDLRVISRGKAICGHGCHEPASEEKVTCPNCKQKVGPGWDHEVHDEMFTCQPAQPEPAPPSEMPEAVHPVARAIDALITASEYYEDEESIAVCVQAAEDLESWWRSQPAPAAVAMTPELRDLLIFVDSTCSLRHDESWRPETLESMKKVADAVRAQASRPQGVKLPKVREALITLSGCIYMQENMDKVIAALAELDAAEERKP